jgi:hypothetical protein
LPADRIAAIQKVAERTLRGHRAGTRRMPGGRRRSASRGTPEGRTPRRARPSESFCLT